MIEWIGKRIDAVARYPGGITIAYLTMIAIATIISAIVGIVIHPSVATHMSPLGPPG